MSEATLPRPGPNRPIPSTKILTKLIVTLLAPIFLTAVGGDLNVARMAAAGTIESYRAETLADLILVAKIVAFGLAALGSLGLSMEDGLPIAMILRLCANAAACDRAEHRSQRILKQSRPDQKVAASPQQPPLPQQDLEFDEAALIAAVAETQRRTAENLARFSTPAPGATLAPAAPLHDEQQYQAAWAASAAQVAAETGASLANLSSEQRRDATIWMGALNDAANEFLAGGIPPRPKPGDLSWMMSSNSR